MGTIERISGPLVVAKDMLDTSMYDVVKVGDAKLIGEIIKLEGEDAVIQVYEDTNGVRPGEKVVSTGTPLSVELGPGILSQIFDGVQRPLDLIKAKSGTFIKRGSEVDAIDKKKKWQFHAEKKHTKGSNVSPGMILGYVEETPLIKHYVMVPPGVSGKLQSIKSGRFAVEDTIAVVKTQKGLVKVSMLQKRSVRQPSKFKTKIAAEVPLVTGQRIIDTFFPVAKGGAASIPGPFGAGKCVTGETKILVNDELKQIREVFEKSVGYVEELSAHEFLKKLETPMKVYSFDGKRISLRLVNQLYKGRTDRLVEVKTKSGRHVRLTPIHKLFAIDEGLHIVEREAAALKPGDYIVSPRKLELNCEYQAVTPILDYTKPETNSNPLKVPRVIDEKLGELLGLLMSDGMIRGAGTVVFFNNDEELLKRAAYLFDDIFGLKAHRKWQRTVDGVQVYSRALVRLLVELGFPTKRKSRNLKPPTGLLASPDTVLESFLKAYISGDGSLGDRELEITTASREMRDGICYILLRLGLLYRTQERRVKGWTYNRIFITSREAAKLYQQYQKPRYFNSSDIVPMTPELFRSVLGGVKPYELEKQGIETAAYYNKQNFTAQVFKKIAGILNETNLLALSEALDMVFLDEVVSLAETAEECDVYDLVVPDTHNFIGGDIPMILHNTVMLHSLAKFSDASIVIYIGCGERGNEMTDVLTEFPELKDPKTGRPLMERTVLIANTSNMPVAAREASVYTGITIAEYFRDMGYDVALMADSTSRWAEAMREISTRLEEMPGEEGYPAYLPKRIAEFYERAGRVETLGGKIGSITLVGAVSPPGGDLSEPVSQGTLRVVKTFWALDAALASSRHFPAINWLTSYSLYISALQKWYDDNLGEGFERARGDAMRLLQREADLKDIVQLVGEDALPDTERVLLEVGRLIRENFLRQSAFDPVDAYTSLKKQNLMIGTMLYFSDKAQDAAQKGVSTENTMKLEVIRKIARMREVKEEEMEAETKKINAEIDAEFRKLVAEHGIVEEKEKEKEKETDKVKK